MTKTSPVIPLIWEGFTGLYLRLEPTLARIWWQALCRSQWTSAREFRQKIWLWNSGGRAQPEDCECFWEEHLTPQGLIAVVEDLVTSQRLRRRQAQEIETAVLAMVRADGGWK